MNPVQATDPEDLASSELHLGKINLFHSLSIPADVIFVTAEASLLQERQRLGRYCRDDLRAVTAKGDNSHIGEEKMLAAGLRQALGRLLSLKPFPPGQHQEALSCPEDEPNVPVDCSWEGASIHGHTEGDLIPAISQPLHYTHTLSPSGLFLPSGISVFFKTTEQSYKAGTHQEDGAKGKPSWERDALYMWAGGTETRIGTQLAKLTFIPSLIPLLAWEVALGDSQ